MKIQTGFKHLIIKAQVLEIIFFNKVGVLGLRYRVQQAKSIIFVRTFIKSKMGFIFL